MQAGGSKEKKAALVDGIVLFFRDFFREIKVQLEEDTRKGGRLRRFGEKVSWYGFELNHTKNPTSGQRESVVGDCGLPSG